MLNSEFSWFSCRLWYVRMMMMQSEAHCSIIIILERKWKLLWEETSKFLMLQYNSLREANDLLPYITYSNWTSSQKVSFYNTKRFHQTKSTHSTYKKVPNVPRVQNVLKVPVVVLRVPRVPKVHSTQCTKVPKIPT